VEGFDVRCVEVASVLVRKWVRFARPKVCESRWRRPRPDSEGEDEDDDEHEHEDEEEEEDEEGADEGERDVFDSSEADE
jgi:carboxylesterase type B